LPADAEQRLDAIPDHIGDAAADEPRITEAAQEGDETRETIASLLDAVAFEEQDVQETLEEFFDFLAERFQSDHWSLTERQSRILGRPTAQLANAIWVKLKLRIPDILARWCESTPGATAFLMAAGIVIVPKVTKQIHISRARKRSPAPASSGKAGDAAAQPRRSAAPRPTGEHVNGVPVMSGVVVK
jgi:hypothetical protein